MPSYFNIIKIF